jgi:acetyltransferase-like isoleucine patch superfamily enzyme
MSSVGPGGYIQEKVVIQANVQFGNNCSVHMGALINHEVRLGHSTYISYGAAISGEVEIGDGVFVGANATIIPRIKIGKFVTIGAGAVVIRDVPDYAVVVGNPARIVNENPRELEHGDVYAD